jgi:hypothetical protein
MFLSFVSAVAALEALAAYVARIDPDETYETLEATDRFVESQRLMLETGSTGKPKRVWPPGIDDPRGETDTRDRNGHDHAEADRSGRRHR